MFGGFASGEPPLKSVNHAHSVVFRREEPPLLITSISFCRSALHWSGDYLVVVIIIPTWRQQLTERSARWTRLACRSDSNHAWPASAKAQWVESDRSSVALDSLVGCALPSVSRRDYGLHWPPCRPKQVDTRCCTAPATCCKQSMEDGCPQ